MTQEDLAQNRKCKRTIQSCVQALLNKTCGFAPCIGSCDKPEDQAVQEQRRSDFLCGDGDVEYQSKPV